MGRIFSTSGHIPGPSLNEVGLLVEKYYSSFPNMKSALDTHLRVGDVVLICEWRRVVLGLQFLNFESHSRPEFERSGIMS